MRRQTMPVTALLIGASLCSCGYEGATLSADIATQARLDGTIEQAVANGFANPDGSTFASGTLLYARWTVSRQEVRTVEVLLDLDERALPNELEPTATPVVLTAGGEQVTAIVRYRLISGRPKSEHVPTAVEVIVRTWRRENRLSSGQFTLDMPNDDGIYTNISGTWETTEAP